MKQLKSIKTAALATVLAACFLFTACGKEKTEPQTDEVIQSFKIPSKTDKDHELGVTRYDHISLEDSFDICDDEKLISEYAPVISGHKAFRLYYVSKADLSQRLKYLFSIYDTETGSRETKEFTYESLGLTGGGITGFDVIDDGHFVFHTVEYEQSGDEWIQRSDMRVYTDLNGNNSRIELLDAFTEAGFRDGTGTSATDLACDCSGNLCGYGSKSDGIYLYAYSKTGELLIDHKLPRSWQFTDCVRTDKDRFLFVLMDLEEYSQHLVVMDPEKKEVEEVSVLSRKEAISCLYAMSGDTLYYQAGNDSKIYAWNVATGKRTLIFDYPGNCIPAAYRSLLIPDAEKEPLLLLYKSTDISTGRTPEWIAVLSADDVLEQTQIVMLRPQGSEMKYRFQDAAGLASDEDLNSTYKITRIDSKEQQDKLIVEIIAGKGPDIMYLTRDDFEEYAKSGLFMEMNELLPEEATDDILPGVIGLGTVSDKLYGLPVWINAESILISNDVWDKPTWNYEEILDLMRAGTIDSQIYYVDMNTYFAPVATASFLIEYCFGDKRIIDLSEKKCHLNDPFVVELLEIIKNGKTTEDNKTWLAGGKRVAFNDYDGTQGLMMFGIREEQENGHYIGFPTSGTTGNYLFTSGILAVNANTKRKDAVISFLNYLFYRENPFEDTQNHALGIYKIKIPEYVQGEDGKLYLGEHEIPVLSNGKTTIEAGAEFLESCVPAPIVYSEIGNIMREELTSYFNGDKSAQEAADILQNRVQLFLDEKMD